MKIQRFPNVCLSALTLTAALLLAGSPAFAQKKEVLQLQTQVQTLQDQMTQMKQSFDERMGVMRNLVEQNTDAVNKATNAVTTLQATLQKQQSDSAGHSDQLSGQIQALND